MLSIGQGVSEITSKHCANKCMLSIGQGVSEITSVRLASSTIAS